VSVKARIVDGEGSTRTAGVTEANRLKVDAQLAEGYGTSEKPLIVAAAGSGEDAAAGFVFGDITTSAIALFKVERTAYTEQTANARRSLVSSSANDTAAGTGARTVKVTYLDYLGNGPYSDIVILSGTTPVDTLKTDICFIERVEVITVGATGSNVGTITLKAATAGGGATIGTIAPTDLQTFWVHHYVPRAKVGHVTTLWAGHNGTTVGSGGMFVIKRKRIGVVDAAEVQITDSFRLYGQSSSVQRNYGTPIQVQGPALLTVWVLPETASTITYRSSFDLYDL
jgi:hypothetical protein